MKCPPAKRNAGRTTWMVNQLIDAIKQGQPQSVVVGHNWDFVTHHLRDMVLDKMRENGLEIELLDWRRRRMVVEGCTVHFTTSNELERFMCGRRGVGVFEDHYACGEM